MENKHYSSKQPITVLWLVQVPSTLATQSGSLGPDAPPRGVSGMQNPGPQPDLVNHSHTVTSPRTHGLQDIKCDYQRTVTTDGRHCTWEPRVQTSQSALRDARNRARLAFPINFHFGWFSFEWGGVSSFLACLVSVIQVSSSDRVPAQVPTAPPQMTTNWSCLPPSSPDPSPRAIPGPTRQTAASGHHRLGWRGHKETLWFVSALQI